MQVRFCGVRGSTPSPGKDFVRYGGNTSCVALSQDGGMPTLVLDAGTGLQQLGYLFAGAPFRGSILLGHLHWDHTHGLPFFAAGDHPDAEVDVFLPEQGTDPEALMARAMSPPHFPISAQDLRGRWRFASLPEGEHVFGAFTVLAREIPHTPTRTFGYRVSYGGASLAYLSDHSPVLAGPGPDGLGAYHEAALELAAGVDLLIHDAQHTATEFAGKAYLGHSAAEYAVGLGAEAGAKRVLLFHHDPPRTDDQIDEISAGLGVEAAAEGLVISL